MRPVLCALLLLAAPAARAQAPDLCPPLTRLLTGAQPAFHAARNAPEPNQHWATAPIVPHAACTLWSAREGDAEALRCDVNDHAEPAAVAAFYDANLPIIDKCLAALPALAPWKRQSAPVATTGLRGAETVWLHDTDAIRFKISLARYERTETNSYYDSFSVEFLRY